MSKNDAIKMAKRRAHVELIDAIKPSLTLLVRGSGDVNAHVDDADPGSVSLLADVTASFISNLVSVAVDAHDVNQPSYKCRTPESALRSAKVEKKKKHLDLCLKQRRNFIPFVASCEGMLGREADVFLKNLAKKLAKKWERPCSRTTAFVRTRFAISMVRAKNYLSRRRYRQFCISTNSIGLRPANFRPFSSIKCMP